MSHTMLFSLLHHYCVASSVQSCFSPSYPESFFTINSRQKPAVLNGLRCAPVRPMLSFGKMSGPSSSFSNPLPSSASSPSVILPCSLVSPRPSVVCASADSFYCVGVPAARPPCTPVVHLVDRCL